MSFLKYLSIGVLLLFATSAFADDAPLTHADRLEKIDKLLSGAISQGLIAGGVVLVGNHAEVLFERA